MYYRITYSAVIFFLLSVAECFAQLQSKSLQEETACAPNIKAIKLEIIKQKTEIRGGEELNFLLRLEALYSVKDVIISLNFSKELKNTKTKSEIKFSKIDSGKVEAIPISTSVGGHSLQSVTIQVKGKMRNTFGNGDIDFQTGEEVGMLYDEQKKTYNIETSFEAMTKTYRMWNLVPEETLRARGVQIALKPQVFDSNFRQAKPVEPKIKRRKSLNHNAAFTEINPDDTTGISSSKNEKSKTLSVNSVQSQVCVTVTGTLYYQDSNGQSVPLPNATIEVWEDDTFDDDYLTSTITNQSGYFSVSLCDDDGLFDSHLEIYVIAGAVCDRVRVMNYTQPGGNTGFNTFAWPSWIVETGGGTVNYGNLIIAGNTLNRGGAKIFDNMQRAWSASVAQGFNPSYTPVVYPAPTSQCGGSSCYTFQTFPGTSLGSIWLQAGEWVNGYEDVSYHEYGHALMHRAFSNAWYPNTGGGSHTVFPQPAGFAWSEGWATFYTQVVQNDGYWTGLSLENKSIIDYNYPTIGEVNEWRVAQAMTDLYDTNVDGNDQGSLAFNRFISTMQSNNSSSLTQFWGQLKNSLTTAEKYYGSRSLIYNTIPVTEETVAPLTASISGPSTIYHPGTKGRTNTYTWNAITTGGASPFSFRWTQNGSTVGNASSYTKSLGYAGGGGGFTQWTLGLTVTDAINQTATPSKLITEYYQDEIFAAKRNGEQTTPILTEDVTLLNYPNPFNPVTQIKYLLPSSALVSVKVYDMLGREVWLVAEGLKEEGFYQIVFDASKFTSGFYVARLSVSPIEGKPFVKTIKMLLTK